MRNNFNKFHHLKFVELIRFSTATLFFGIVAASFMMGRPLLACFLGLAGLVNFILSKKYDEHPERIETLLAVLGLTLSLVSLVYVLAKFFSN